MSTRSDILKERSVLVEEGVKKLKEAQVNLANKIGPNLRFELLSENDLKAYFVVFDERLMDMVDHLDDLVLLNGYCSWVVVDYAQYMSLRMEELHRAWAVPAQKLIR